MPTSQQLPHTAIFDVQNIGGIDDTKVDIPPGVTVLTGENATNRTSLLQAIMAAMGSNQATLKGDAEEGFVELELKNKTYKRELSRVENGVQFSGEGYLDEPNVADLFSFLLESNEARQSVARGDDLREIIMRPVDVDAIKNEINQIKEEKDEINDKLATIESRERDLPNLEKRRTSLRERIEDKREELATKEEAIEANNRNVEQSRKEQSKLEAKFDELRSTRSDLESIRRKIERQQESLSSLKQERSDIESELNDLPETPMGDHPYLDEELDRLRAERQTLNSEISELQSLIQYNEERLESEDSGVIQTLDDLPDIESSGAITDKLLESETESVVCWTCGSTVESDQIEDTVDRLRDLRSQKVDALNDIKSEIDELKTDQREAEQKQNRREEIERKLDELNDELDQREAHIDSLKDNREELTSEIESLEAEVDALESTNFDDVLSLHKEANQLEFEIESLEANLDNVTTEIEEIEAQVEHAEDLREKREELVDEIADKRTKIEQIETEAVEEFNEHMNAVLEILEYDNLDRIWIDQVSRTVRDGRQKVERAAFELHVVRSTENGTAYEDTIEHLSESEREVTGLIFALAGYLVHDLHESVPFMLLDSLEAIDADRIAKLVDYFAEYAYHLVVALLHEDAQALDDEYTRVTAI